MLFPLKKRQSVVFPLGPVKDQSRITPRHLILNLIRRMSRTSLHERPQRTIHVTVILNNEEQRLTSLHIHIRLSSWYLMMKYTEQQMVHIVTHVRAHVNHYLTKKNTEQRYGTHNQSMWYTIRKPCFFTIFAVNIFTDQSKFMQKAIL